MSTSNPAGRERAEALMMAELDGELGADARRELEALVAADPGLAAELTRLRRVKEVTSMVTLRTPSDEVWDGYWQGSYRRAERGVGWLLVAAGALLLAVWWIWHALGALWGDGDAPLVVRAGATAVLAGGLVLLVSVVRERLVTKKHDPYDREVIR